MLKTIKLSCVEYTTYEGPSITVLNYENCGLVKRGICCPVARSHLSILLGVLQQRPVPPSTHSPVWTLLPAQPSISPNRAAHGTQRRFSLNSSCGHQQPCLHFHTSWLSHLRMAWLSKPTALFTYPPLAKSRYLLVITYTHPAQFLRKTCGIQTRGPGIPDT